MLLQANFAALIYFRKKYHLKLAWTFSWHTYPHAILITGDTRELKVHMLLKPVSLTHSLTAHPSLFSLAFSSGWFSSNFWNNFVQFCGLIRQHNPALRCQISHWKIPTPLWLSCNYPNVCHCVYMCIDSSIDRMKLDHWFHSDSRHWLFRTYVF